MLVTGTTSNSRVTELKKYAVGVPFTQQYVSGGDVLNDGVDYTNSVSGVTMTYYLGGIKFVDDVSGGTTTFSVTAQGTGSANFIDVPYYKDPNESKIISNPKINDDVFIVRESQSAFDKNYRLEYITRLPDLTTYAGGRYFNIINNT